MKKAPYNRRDPDSEKTEKKLPRLVGEKYSFAAGLYGLQYLADRFNELRTPEKLDLQEREAWDLAERVASGVVVDPEQKHDENATCVWTGDPGRSWFKISRPVLETTILGRVSPPSLETARERFNMYFAHAPVRLVLWSPMDHVDLEVLPGAEPPRDSKAPHTARAAFFLWWFFFHDEGWKRMHRCQECRKWIVARGRNKVIRFCSPDCTWKHWNWTRRKNHPNRTNPTRARKRRK